MGVKKLSLMIFPKVVPKPFRVLTQVVLGYSELFSIHITFLGSVIGALLARGGGSSPGALMTPRPLK